MSNKVLKGVDRYMTLCMNTRRSQLWKHFVRAKEHVRDGAISQVVPIVIKNSSWRWILR